MVTVGGVLKVQQEIGTDTIDPSRRDLVMGNGLVLENDASDVDGSRVQLRARRNRVVAGLETGNGGDDQIEGHVPSGCVLRRRRDGNIGAGG